MDVDDGSSQGGAPQQPSPQQQPQDDIESSFLQQFNCLGTTDHDELVSQLQNFMGNSLNYATARFFLDMNNWNLQAAIGCYFDFNSGQKMPVMQVMGDVTVGEGESVTPNTKFSQSWQIKNNGDESWPCGCYLKCASPEARTDGIVHVNALRPGEHTEMQVELYSPAECGSFQTKWGLCMPNGTPFGEPIWSIVQVSESGTLALTQHIAKLKTTADGGGASGIHETQVMFPQNTVIALGNGESWDDMAVSTVPNVDEDMC